MRALAHRIDYWRFSRLTLGVLALAGATTLWTVLAVGFFTGSVTLPYGKLVMLGYPLALLALALGEGPRRRPMLLAGGWSSLVVGAFLLIPAGTSSLAVPLALFAIIAAAFVCSRVPAASVITAFFLTGTLGSILAFTGHNAGRVTELILAGLWVGLLARFVASARHPQRVLWSATIACIAYITLTFVEIFTAVTPGIGFLSFRTSAWYMMAFLLLGYAGWPAATYRRISRGMIVATALVAGYAVLRWQIGPSSAEAARARYVVGGINLVNGQLRTVGSFTTGHELALWTGFMAPFCIAFAVANRGRWRLLGYAGVILCIFAMLASQARGPLVGMVVGIVAVLGLFQVARAFPGLNLGVTASAVAGVIAVGAIAFTLTAGNSGNTSRYTDVFHPTNDLGYSIRQGKWQQAFKDIGHHPLGQGLGSAGFVQEQFGQYLTVASNSLDSSYLKIAYEQGFAVMVFFIVAMLALAGRMSVAAVSATDGATAAAAIGAVGTLLSVLVSFYSGLYIESLPVLGAWLVVGVGLAGLVTRPVDAQGPAGSGVSAPSAA